MATPALSTVTHQEIQQLVPLLIVADLAAALRFYCDGLGFAMTNRAEQNGQPYWCWLQLGGAALMLQQATDEDPPAQTWGRGVTHFILCRDAAAIHARITARGVQASPPEVAFYGMQQTYVTDPDGYVLCFENPVPTGQE